MLERQRQLRALGIEMLVQRGAPGKAATQGQDEPETPAPAVCLRLWFAEGQTPQEAGAQRLLRDVLRSLGLTPEQATGSDPDLPQLAFGEPAPEGAIALAALARLRDPLEKRIAWPVLRRLHRRLRTGEA